MRSVRKWLKTTIDEKPWWSIILAAALGAIGSEAIENIPAFYSWGRSFFPIEPTIHVFVRSKGPNMPIDGVRLSVLDTTTLTPVAIIDSAGGEVTTVRGFATAKVRVKPRAGYAIVLNHTHNQTEYRLTAPIEIKGDFQHSVEFDPAAWEPAGQAIAAPAEPAPALQARGELPAWMKYAYAEVGQREVPGAPQNERILEYLRSTRSSVPANEEMDWSAAFVQWVLSKAEIRGTNSTVNRAWLSWGSPLSSPRLGCVAVFWRDSPSGQLGHAGFYVGEQDDRILVLGGNQANAVSIAPIPKSTFLGCRWPA